MSRQRIFAIVIRHLYIWPRSLERLMWSFGWPFFDLIIWGLVSSYLVKNASGLPFLVNVLLGGIILWTIVWRIQNEINVNFLDEGWNKNLINIFSTPLTKGEFLTAMIILGLIKISITLSGLMIGAFFLYQFNFLSSFGFYIPLLLINLLVFAWGFGFLINGLILRFGYTVQEFAWALIVLVQPFSCVFYPLSYLPLWAQKIALFLPTTYVFEEMRRILFTGLVNWYNLLISFVLNIIYLILALGFFRFMYEKAREHGRLVKLN